MRLPYSGAPARLLLVLTLVLGTALSSVSMQTSPLGAPHDSPSVQAQGKTQQAKKGKRDGKQRKGKGKAKTRGASKGKKQGQKQAPAALDAKQIAAENAAAVAAFDCEGLEKIDVDGRTYCTHGEDPPLTGPAAGTSGVAGVQTTPPFSTASRPLCIDDGQSGPRVQLVYIHRHDQASRLTELLPTFRRLASEMDTIVDQSARKTGDSLRIRFVTNAQCQVDIPALAVNAGSIGSFGGVIGAMQNAGFNRLDRKYLMLVDASVFCGVGTFLRDDTPGTTAHDFAGYARVDRDCWDAGTLIHELSHTMGAVQYSAPHTSKGAHCIDEWDVMCYSDSPFKPKMQFLCQDGAQDFRLDCNDDDYFAAQPAAGSYLASHWNIAQSIYFTPGHGDVCPDAALEPDDAYWYDFWEVPMRQFPVGGSEARAFCDEPGDTDWILFSGEQGKGYQIETSGLGADVDTQLVVYRGFEEQGWNNMDQVGFNDDRAPGDASSLLTFTAPGTGTYLVGVSESAGRAGLDKTYTIAVREVPASASATLALSRAKSKPGRPFTATMSGLTPTSEVSFWLEKSGRTTELGQATADDSGVAIASLRIPKGARTGGHQVEALSSDGATASAAFKVEKKGGRDHKGGKKHRKKARKRKHGHGKP